MDQRPRILLAIPHLDGGGAERVFSLLVTGLSSQKYDIHLALITASTIPHGRFPPCVTVHALGAPRVRKAALPLLQLVRRIKPCVLLSGMYHLNFLVLLLRPFFPQDTRILVRQNGFVSAALACERLPLYTRWMYRTLYRRAERVICQSPTMARDLIENIGIPASRLIVLLNPVDMNKISNEDTVDHEGAQPSSHWIGPGPHLLAVGRLAKEKGFDLLLNALVSVSSQFPNVELILAGSGPEEAALKRQCSELGLNTSVRFAGHIDRPQQYYQGADAFVLSSRHEGMPNALLEAAAGGLPILALPAAGGIADLLRGQNGTSVAAEISSAALAATLLEALQSLQPAQRFAHPFLDPFRMENSIAAYEALIDATIDNSRPSRGPKDAGMR
jgi:glycosyltransferase involved in cell wall biosynthesis